MKLLGCGTQVLLTWPSVGPVSSSDEQVSKMQTHTEQIHVQAGQPTQRAGLLPAPT